MKRRAFIQNIAAIVSGGGAALKAKKDVGLEHLEGEQVTVIHKGLTATDICNEALEKIGCRSGTKFIAETRPADGKYLDADEVQCCNCRSIIPIPKGFYAPGDEIECTCGNRALFVLNAKVETGV